MQGCRTHEWFGRVAGGDQQQAVRARHHALFERIDREAHKAALEGLGLAGLYAELEQAVDQEAELAAFRKAYAVELAELTAAAGREPAYRWGLVY